MCSAAARGWFITFEGLDGSGKSTQLRRLSEWLSAHGHEVTVTRQPGDTRIGERIRGLILDSRTENLAPRAELGLMFSDRAQGIAEIIEPALAAGRVVLCDRFTDSTEAYQGGGRQLGSEVVLNLHAALCGNLQPDLTLLLMPDFERSLRRARSRNTRAARQGKDENRFEREDELFYRRVWDAYRQIAAREPVRVVAIEGDAAIDEVHQRIVEVVQQRLGIHDADRPERTAQQ
jgi:dTMP kinase